MRGLGPEHSESAVLQRLPEKQNGVAVWTLAVLLRREQAGEQDSVQVPNPESRHEKNSVERTSVGDRSRPFASATCWGL